MATKELRDLIFEDYYGQTRFPKQIMITIQQNIRRKKIYYFLQLN